MINTSRFTYTIFLQRAKNSNDWLFKSHCRKMSSLLIYKQPQQDELANLYREVMALRKKVPKTELHSLQDVAARIRKNFFRHYACLVTKDDGTKLVTFVTNSKMVDNELTLPLFEGCDYPRITRTGFLVDEQYEKTVLANIPETRDTQMDKSKTLLGKKDKTKQK